MYLKGGVGKGDIKGDLLIKVTICYSDADV